MDVPVPTPLLAELQPVAKKIKIKIKIKTQFVHRRFLAAAEPSDDHFECPEIGQHCARFSGTPRTGCTASPSVFIVFPFPQNRSPNRLPWSMQIDCHCLRSEEHTSELQSL